MHWPAMANGLEYRDPRRASAGGQREARIMPRRLLFNVPRAAGRNGYPANPEGKPCRQRVLIIAPQEKNYIYMQKLMQSKEKGTAVQRS